MVDVRALDGVLSLVPDLWDFWIERVDGQYSVSFGLPDGTRTPPASGKAPASAAVAALLAECSEWFAIHRQSGGQIAEVMAAEPRGRSEPALAPFRTGDPGKRMDTLVPTPEWKAFTIAARERGLSISLLLRLAARAYLSPPPGIAWVPIADMPEAWKSDTGVLLWADDSARFASWSFVRKRWEDGESVVRDPTHVAAINPPEGL